MTNECAYCRVLGMRRCLRHVRGRVAICFQQHSRVSFPNDRRCVFCGHSTNHLTLYVCACVPRILFDVRTNHPCDFTTAQWRLRPRLEYVYILFLRGRARVNGFRRYRLTPCAYDEYTCKYTPFNFRWFPWRFMTLVRVS